MNRYLQSFALKSNLVLAILLLVVLVAVASNLEPFWVHVLIYTLWFVYMSVAWNIFAVCGPISFAHTTYLGAGAYASTLLYKHFGVSPWLGMLVGAALAVVLAAIVGWVSLRAGLPPLSMALVTMGFMFMVLFIVTAIPFLGGTDGLHVGFLGDSLWLFQWSSKLPYFYVMLAMTVGIVVLARLIETSKLGLYSAAIRQNPDAAAAAGVDLMGYQMYALIISAALMAPAGTFWAQYTLYVDPQTNLGPGVTILIILFAALGGVFSVAGAVIGPAVLVPIGEVLRVILGDKQAGLSMVFYGVIVILIIMFMPQGMVGMYRRVRERVFRSALLGRAPARSPEQVDPT